MNREKRRGLMQIILERKRIFLKLRLKKKMGHMKKTDSIAKLKKEIAKIMTKINNNILL